MKQTIHNIHALPAQDYISPQMRLITAGISLPVCTSGFNSSIEDLNDETKYEW